MLVFPIHGRNVCCTQTTTTVTDPPKMASPLTYVPRIANEEAPEVTQEPHKAWELWNGLGSFQRKDPVVVGPPIVTRTAPKEPSLYHDSVRASCQEPMKPGPETETPAQQLVGMTQG